MGALSDLGCPHPPPLRGAFPRRGRGKGLWLRRIRSHPQMVFMPTMDMNSALVSWSSWNSPSMALVVA